MSILPAARPVIKRSSFEKICRYFFEDRWNQFPVVELAVRQKKVNFYDDELIVWRKSDDSTRTFNWNADPSAYIIKGIPKAVLKKGVHFYTLSYHHKWNPAKRYPALRPATPGEQLPVWRMGDGGTFYSSVGTAINQHKGGADSTWSEGCQTAHFSQYAEFIGFIAAGLGYKVPPGTVKTPDPVLMTGLGRFPYILIDQKDFNYIVNLSETEFDSTADLKYQTAHFTSLPRIEKANPVAHEIENASAILAAVEIEAEENLQVSAVPVHREIPPENPPSNTPATENSFRAPAFLPPELQKVKETIQGKVRETIENGEGEIEKSISVTKDIFEPLNIPAFIPRFGKQWFLGLIPGAGFVSTVIAYIQNAPQWLVFLLGAMTGIALWNFFGLLIKHREKVGDFLIHCYQITGNPAMHNLIPTNARKFIGERFEMIEEVFEKPG